VGWGGLSRLDSLGGIWYGMWMTMTMMMIWFDGPIPGLRLVRYVFVWSVSLVWSGLVWLG
jgi:hypothetical protein